MRNAYKTILLLSLFYLLPAVSPAEQQKKSNSEKGERTLLHELAASNDAVMMQTIIDTAKKEEKDTGLGLRDPEGKTPLHEAAFFGSYEAVKLLLKEDARLEDKSNSGKTALHWAITGNQFKMTNLLIRRGADIEARDYYQRTPLHLAAEQCNKPIVTLLLDKGANPNAQDEALWTPLHFTAKWCKASLSEKLLDAGANYALETITKQSALDYALSNKPQDPEVVRLLSILVEE